jgi:ferrochelatase
VAGSQRIRIILAAHGEAETAGMAEHFRVSWRTLAHAAHVMRLPAPLRVAICSVGSLRRRLAGRPGSVHNSLTRQQAKALEQVLKEGQEVTYRVEAAFASAPPYLDDALRIPDGVDRQILISMIPTDSRLSCGLICHPLAATPERQRTAVLARMWDSPNLITVHCNHIAANFPSVEPDSPCCLVLALHGTVVRDKQGNEPDFHAGIQEKAAYGEALRTALLAMPDPPWQRVEIAYLNHGVGGEWSSPTLPELLSQIAAEGVGSVVAYTCEHLVDGSETTQLPRVLDAGPVPETHCLPCLNTSEPFIDFLAARVREAAPSPGIGQTCGQCPLNRSESRRTTNSEVGREC